LAPPLLCFCLDATRSVRISDLPPVRKPRRCSHNRPDDNARSDDQSCARLFQNCACSMQHATREATSFPLTRASRSAAGGVWLLGCHMPPHVCLRGVNVPSPAGRRRAEHGLGIGGGRRLCKIWCPPTALSKHRAVVGGGRDLSTSNKDSPSTPLRHHEIAGRVANYGLSEVDHPSEATIRNKQVRWRDIAMEPHRRPHRSCWPG
jgi:hypothetical protein